MNACREFAALLDPYVDGELPLEEAARVRAHLERCGGCRSYVDAALAIRAAFPSAEETAVPEGFAEGVLAALRPPAPAKTPPRRKRKSPWTRLLLPLAACCALVILVQRVPWNTAPAEAPQSTTADAEAPQGQQAIQPFLAAPASGGAPEAAEDTAPAENAAPEAAENAAPEAEEDTAPLPRLSATGGGQAADSKASSPAEPASEPTAHAEEGGGTGRSPVTASGQEAPPLAGPPEAADAAPEDGVANESAPETEAWVAHGNVVFAATVYVTPETAGEALDGFEGRPYSSALLPEKGTLGTGYALEQTDFERILDQLGLSPAPPPDPERTTELRCIVVTEDPGALG